MKAMKRSQINQILRDAARFFAERQFYLPAYADWTPEDWRRAGAEADEIRQCGLGWDVTDFGSGDFQDTGLLLFTLRNGVAGSERYAKPYAEKIMMVGEGQKTPYHFHWHKMEDIINRGGGNLVVKLYAATPGENLSDAPVTAYLDGQARVLPAGSEIRLRPGESITLLPRQYHSFWGEAGFGAVLVGEVSQVNDDRADNRFLEPLPRFPAIVEDEAPWRLLVAEYPPA